jgi:hypothetical protein
MNVVQIESAETVTPVKRVAVYLQDPTSVSAPKTLNRSVALMVGLTATPASQDVKG